MRYINIDQVESGDTLARSIYSSDGLTLLHSNVQLTVGMIHKLRRFGVNMLYITDPNFSDVEIEDAVTDETKREAISNLSSALQCVQSGKGMEIRSLQKSITNIVDETLRNRRVLLNLNDIRTADNHLFIHSLNVCMMSTTIGVGLGYNNAQLKELALGALLHDIGKSVKDDGQTTGMSQDNHHTWLGFNLLRKKHEMSIVSAHVALQHHEWVNGAGIPRGLAGAEIHDFAKIVAITNYYDNLISPFSSSEEETCHPYEACEKIMGLANIRFDHDMVIRFLRSIATYPTGSSLRLSTGEVGVVVDQNRGLPTRPIVRIIKKERSRSQRMEEDHNCIDIDLGQETTIFINGVLE